MTYKACKEMLKSGRRPAGMDFKSYSALAKASGDEPMDEKQFMAKAEEEAEAEDDEAEGAEAEGGDEGGDEGEPAEKSEAGAVDPDALSKALNAYGAVEDAIGAAGASREDYLNARMEAGTITKSERVELLQLLTAEGEDAPDTAIRKSVSETLAETSPGAGDLVDASDFLQDLVKSMDASLDGVANEVARDGRATRELLKAQGNLVKALVADTIESRKVTAAQAQVIDALATRLGLIERQPQLRKSVSTRHDPRAVVNRPLAKSANGGTDPEAETLTKSQVQRGLNTLMKAASDAGDEQAMDRIATATAKFESFHTVSPNIEKAIRQALGTVNGNG